MGTTYRTVTAQSAQADFVAAGHSAGALAHRQPTPAVSLLHALRFNSTVALG